MERGSEVLRSSPVFPAVAYNGPRRRARMGLRPPDTLEVHVSFEINRLAPTYLRDAYELLVPTVSVRKPAATESQSASLRPIPATEEQAG